METLNTILMSSITVSLRHGNYLEGASKVQMPYTGGLILEAVTSHLM